MDVVSQVIKKEGVLGLYAGMEATFWRQVSHIYYQKTWEWNGVRNSTKGGPVFYPGGLYA